MCLYFKRSGCDMTIVGVYVGDLLISASSAALVQELCLSMGIMFIKDLGKVRKFLGMRNDLDKDEGYTLDQQAVIEELLEEHGLAKANGVHRPLSDENYDANYGDARLFEHKKDGKGPTIR
ncbi:unnamed protein product [Peronospora belbahrii]|uniref:Reverse transcriptase Ty1/copia-type domain-containing protein n=1 Tax=Peronospora belbahrii TaxID=622444 RepID=A0ABN8CRB9_9STRA|nr:unnamed protein product [Peronospora belbahrii]